MTFAVLLRDHARTSPGRVALRSRESSWTWTDLDALVDRAAAGLLASCATRVAIALPNDINFVITLLGAMRAGLIAVPVNPGFTEREMRHVLTDSGADLLIGSSVEGFRSMRKPPEATPASQFPDADDNDVALLIYTSGTEGAPKGAMLTHRALIANHRQLAQVEPPVMTEKDTVLLVLPMFHVYGLNTGLGAVLYYGATGVLEAGFDPLATAGIVTLNRVTVVTGVPAMFQAWAELPNAADLLRSLRLPVCGAAALEPQIAARFQERTGLAIHIGYGLTETAPVLTSTVVSPRIKPGSIGRPIPGVELKLVNEYGEALDEDPGFTEDPGEIVVRGENLFSGYWPDGRGGPDADGWWHTGDVAYADAEGDLFIVDRIGELIIVNGFNVYPAEVEQVLYTHPRVAEAAVVGAADPSTGHTVHAFIVADGEVTEAEIAAHCAENLARFKCPTRIEFVAELPHSAIGKVRKTLLREEA